MIYSELLKALCEKQQIRLIMKSSRQNGSLLDSTRLSDLPFWLRARGVFWSLPTNSQLDSRGDRVPALPLSRFFSAERQRTFWDGCLFLFHVVSMLWPPTEHGRMRELEMVVPSCFGRPNEDDDGKCTIAPVWECAITRVRNPYLLLTSHSLVYLTEERARKLKRRLPITQLDMRLERKRMQNLRTFRAIWTEIARKGVTNRCSPCKSR